MPVAWSTFNFNIFNFSQLQTPFATRLASCTCRKLCALEEAAFVPLYLSTELQPGKTVCCVNAQTANCRPQTKSPELCCAPGNGNRAASAQWGATLGGAPASPERAAAIMLDAVPTQYHARSLSLRGHAHRGRRC